METLLIDSTPQAATDRVLAGLDYDADYTTSYQPPYDHNALYDAVYELHTMSPVSTPDHVNALQSHLTALAEGADTPMVMTGRCAEPVRLNVSTKQHVANILAEQAIIRDSLQASGGEVLFVPRAMGQAAKPRSKGPVRLADGTVQYPYMGDAINGEAEHERRPDPSRMVGMAIQSREIKAALEQAIGGQVFAAHEALLLPYEHAMVRVDPHTGANYGLSGELLWAGVRTNGLEGGPIDLLAAIENPSAVKIGPATTPEDVEALVARLNPERVPGKLTFMLRTGPEQADRQADLLAKIRNTALGSVVLWDIHALGKDRNVPRVIKDIQDTARACNKAGVVLHGVHLESIADNSRLECADYPDQHPTHPGGVDPQLNPRQLQQVLRAISNCLLQP